jgi:hypothetical protein
MPQQRSLVLPDYAACERCPEYYRAALRDIDGHTLCANCADHYHPRRRCLICAKVLPCQAHHVGSKIRYPHFTVLLCLNCHRILNTRQYRWRRDGSAERHPLRYLVCGVLDVLALWRERSPVAEQCRNLFAMLGQAALYLIPCLRLEALCELSFLGVGAGGGL